MALITCRECGAQISDTAPACPHCGAPAAVRQQAAQPVQQQTAQPYQQYGMMAGAKISTGFQRVREVFLIIAALCAVIMGIGNGVVLSKLGKFDINDFRDVRELLAALPHIEDEINDALRMPFWVGVVMLFVSLMAMVILFCDRKAKRKIIGFGWFFFSLFSILMVFGAMNNWSGVLNGRREYTIGGCSGSTWTSLGADVIVLVLIIVGIVSTEKQIKEKNNAVQLS